MCALVPERPLEEVVREQARRRAARRVGAVGHAMALEGQAGDGEILGREVEAFAARLVDARGLWGDE